MSGHTQLEFIPDGHRYLLNGRQVPSVTQVLEPLIDYSHVPPNVLAAAAALGTAVHTATALDDQDDLDEASVHEQVWSYLRAWRRFRRETRFVPEHIECRLYSRVHRYAGTADRVGLLPDLRYRGRSLIEIKTTADFMPSFGPQLAGYWQALRESRLYPNNAAVAIRRFAVQLREDETYRMLEYPDRSDWQVFHACLTLHNYTRK